MREGIRDHEPPGLLLQPVIADLEGGVERRFDVARFEEVVFLLSMKGPNASQVIGLKLQPHGEFVGLGLARGFAAFFRARE